MKVNARCLVVPPEGTGDPRHTWCLLQCLDGSFASPVAAGLLGALVDIAGPAGCEWILTHASCRAFVATLQDAGAVPLVEPVPGMPSAWPHPAWHVFDLAATGLTGLEAFGRCHAAAGDGGPSHALFEIFGVPADAKPALAKSFTRIVTYCAEEDRLPDGALFRLGFDPHGQRGLQLFLPGDCRRKVEDVLVPLQVSLARGSAS